MVLFLPDNQEHDSPSCSPDVAAYRGKSWLVRLQLGLGGETPPFYQIPCLGVGRRGNGNSGDTVNPVREENSSGRWERCNELPTGGRQYSGDTVNSMGTTKGDDLRVCGAVVLLGATSVDRRIAQASNADQYGLCGVLDLRVFGESAESFGATRRWSRDQNMLCVGKPGFRNIYPAKSHYQVTDCTAKHTTCSAGYIMRKRGDDSELTREVPCYTSEVLRNWRQGMGAAASRFNQFEQGGNALVRAGYWSMFDWAESGYQVQGLPLVNLGSPARITAATPSTKTLTVGPRRVSSLQADDSPVTVVKNASVPLLPSFGIEAVSKSSTPTTGLSREQSAAVLHAGLPVGVPLRASMRRANSERTTKNEGAGTPPPRHCTRLPESHSVSRSGHDAPTAGKHVRLYQRGVPVTEGRSRRFLAGVLCRVSFHARYGLNQVGSVAALP